MMTFDRAMELVFRAWCAEDQARCQKGNHFLTQAQYIAEQQLGLHKGLEGVHCLVCIVEDYKRAREAK